MLAIKTSGLPDLGGFATLAPHLVGRVLLRDAMQMTWTLIDIVAQDERVMAWVRCEGRHVGEFFGIPPTGHEFSFEAMHAFRVEDEIVREHPGRT